MNNMMLWITIGCNALIILAFAVTPYVTRKTELFGISLPSQEIGRFELSEMRRAYLRETLTAGLVLLALNILLFLFISHDMTQVRIYLILLIAYCAVAFLIYLRYHKKMTVFKQTQPWRSYGESPKDPAKAAGAQPSRRDVVHPAWLLIYAAVGVMTLLYLLYIWPSLPDRIPVNMDASGVVAEYIDKGAGAFFTMLIGQWIVIAAFIFVNLMIPFSKKQIDADRPDESREQGRRFRFIVSALMVFSGAALAVVVGYIPIAMAMSDGGMGFLIAPLIFIVVIIVGMLAVMFRVGQGGSKLKVKTEEASALKSTDVINATDDDRYWKLGMFYFNPADPTLFVEKRFGIGWTINFARPAAMLFFAGIIVAIVIVMIVAYSA